MKIQRVELTEFILDGTKLDNMIFYENHAKKEFERLNNGDHRIVLTYENSTRESSEKLFTAIRQWPFLRPQEI